MRLLLCRHLDECMIQPDDRPWELTKLRQGIFTVIRIVAYAQMLPPVLENSFPQYLKQFTNFIQISFTEMLQNRQFSQVWFNSWDLLRDFSRVGLSHRWKLQILPPFSFPRKNCSCKVCLKKRVFNEAYVPWREGQIRRSIFGTKFTLGYRLARWRGQGKKTQKNERRLWRMAQIAKQAVKEFPDLRI